LQVSGFNALQDIVRIGNYSLTQSFMLNCRKDVLVRLPSAPVACPAKLRQLAGMTSRLAAAFALPALLAACTGAEAPPADPAPATATAVASAPASGSGTAPETEEVLELRADSRSGELSIDLPQGAGASIRLPKAVASDMMADGKVDIDGVGLYPGGKVTGLKVMAREADGRKTETVEIGFTAPATPETVAKWYSDAFVASGGTASRVANRVLATSSEGATVTVELAREGEGASRGTLRVLEISKG
jgi:hypothetical protein